MTTTRQGKILDVQNVSVSFDGFTVLEQLNFSIDYDELRFLIGPNGAGKTTLLDIITGKTKPTSGTVLFDGHNIRRLSEHQIVQQGIGRKFQTPSIFNTLTIYENLEQAISMGESNFRLLGKASAEKREKLDQMIETIGLAEQRYYEAARLSHGQKQWLEIGMLLIQEPKLLLLDEPVAGMTRKERTRTGELVQQIAKQTSVLVVEHDMEFVREFSNKVTVLHMGNVLMEGHMDEVQANESVIEVYLGRSRSERTPKKEKAPVAV